MPIATVSLNRSVRRAAPSSIEYSVCTWRWTKESLLAATAARPPVVRAQFLDALVAHCAVVLGTSTGGRRPCRCHCSYVATTARALSGPRPPDSNAKGLTVLTRTRRPTDPSLKSAREKAQPHRPSRIVDIAVDQDDALPGAQRRCAVDDRQHD